MHIPDGFIDLRTSAAFAAVSAVAVAGAVKGARKQLSEQSAPLAGLTAVFIFAVQMLNFPVANTKKVFVLGRIFFNITKVPKLTQTLKTAILKTLKPRAVKPPSANKNA